MTEQWFAFRAYNTEARYGYGTAAEAEQYADIINEGREINVFGAYPLNDAEAAELQLMEDRSDTFRLDYEIAAWRDQ